MNVNSLELLCWLMYAIILYLLKSLVVLYGHGLIDKGCVLLIINASDKEKGMDI